MRQLSVGSTGGDARLPSLRLPCSLSSHPSPSHPPQTVLDKYSSSAKLLRAYGRFLEARALLLLLLLQLLLCLATGDTDHLRPQLPSTLTLPSHPPLPLTSRTCAATRGRRCATTGRRTAWSVLRLL